MNFPLYIAKRYLFSKSSNNTINIITIIAFVGVIIGSMALFIVLSGFAGLKTFSINFLRVSDPDIKITTVKGKSFNFNATIKSKIETVEGIAQYTKVVEERAFFEFKNKTQLAKIKGVEENFLTVNSIDSAIVDGQWIDFDYTNNAVIGNGISNKLSLGINNYLEPLKIYVPKPGSGYVESVKKDISTVLTQPVGIFLLSEEIDNKYVFIPLELAQQLLNYNSNQISAIELKINEDVNRSTLIDNLQKTLGTDYKIETREQLNAVFYKMLNIENLVSYLIFTLILIIALFNVIGALIMMIFDKKNNLQTLYNLGSTVKELRKIFVYQGFLLSLFGLIVGLILAIILVFLQQQFGFFMITQSKAFPVELKLENILIVAITIVVLGYFASLIASSRISKNIIT